MRLDRAGLVRHKREMLIAALRFIVLVLMFGLASAAAAEPIMIPGPAGSLEGELLAVPDAEVAVLIVPGSGPIDRDGNSPQGLATDTYKLLAEGLASDGITTLRIDKRGFFGSEAAIADPEDVTIAAYADDVRRWHEALAERVGTDCVWIAGHSEGGLVALAAVADGVEPCGLILLAAPGRRVSELLREQVRRYPANGPFLAEIDRIIDGLEAGEITDPATISPELHALFRPGLQRFMIDLFSYDPAELAARVDGPVLIVQGGADVQVTTDDARLLAEAMPDAALGILPEMTHTLKQDVPGQPFATYADPSLPLDPDLMPLIVRVVREQTAASSAPD